MARARRRGLRLFLAAALLIGLWLAWISTVGTPSALETLPAGASAVIEVHDAGAIADRVGATRFATAFADSASREWLERTKLLHALDSLLAEVKRATGISLGRSTALELVESEAAAAWYAPAGAGREGAHWVAAGRLSLRAWAAAGALRLAERALGAEGIVREKLAGRQIYAVPGGGSAAPLRLFLAGRMLIASSDRDLAIMAAQALRGEAPPISRDPGLSGIREALPSSGEVFFWARGGALPAGAGFPGGAGPRAAGGRIKTGSTVEIEIAAEPPAAPRNDVSGGPADLPALSLLKGAPLAFLSSREAVPAPLVALLQDRLQAAARRGAGASPGRTVVPGRGFALVLTGSAVGSGLLPAPRGLVAIGMQSGAAARTALPLLFPPGARGASAGDVAALASRESIPLAGDFELWGAAIGPQLVFATDIALLASAAGSAGPGANTLSGTLPDTHDWRIDTVAELSMEQAMPLLRRWGPALSGLLAARWPELPDIARDLELLAAVRTARVVVGSDGKRDRALVTLHLLDLP